MTEVTNEQDPAPQVDLEDEDLDTAVGGAAGARTDVKGIRDGTSNITDGTSNT